VVRFLLRRAAFAVLSVLAATVIVFTVSRLGGDPREIYARPEGYGMSKENYEALGKKLGLDRPLIVQYFMWVGRIIRLDFGRTLFTERPVLDVLREKAPATVQLGVVSWALATLIGVPFGVLSAVNRGGTWDYLARGFALLGQATPAFWMAIMFIILFSVRLGWLPSGTKGEPDASMFQQLKHFVLPTVVLGTHAAASYLRLTRSALLEVLDSEYIKLARAKGVSRWAVIWKHALRNALIPPLTFSALLLAGLFNGAVIAETVFGWPGIGRLAAEATFENDFPTVTAVVLFFTLLYVGMAFLADVLYAVIDPRIRY